MSRNVQQCLTDVLRGGRASKASEKQERKAFKNIDLYTSCFTTWSGRSATEPTCRTNFCHKTANKTSISYLN